MDLGQPKEALRLAVTISTSSQIWTKEWYRCVHNLTLRALAVEE